MTRTCFALVGILALAAGCSEKPKVESMPAPVVVVDSDASLPANKRLALQKLSGSDGADKAIASAQEIVRQNMAKDESWIVLGRAWVRKARESTIRASI